MVQGPHAAGRAAAGWKAGPTGLLIFAALLSAFVVLSSGCSAAAIEERAWAAWTATAAARPPTSTPEPTATRVSATSTPRPVPSTTAQAVRAAVPTPTAGRVAAILSRAAEIRGLPIKGDVPLGYLDRDQLRAYLVKEFEKENTREQMEMDKAILALLDLLEEKDDLYGLYLDALTDEVSGFYDFETRGMKLITSNRDLQPMDELVLVHEYVHAIQDQNFNLGARMKADKGDAEKAVALRSLAEGDATLFMGVYAQRFMSKEQMAALQGQPQPGGPSEQKLKSAPPVLEWSMMFPYVMGMSFVGGLIQRSGMEGVNRAYSNPPVTSEQIMHVEKYLSGEGPGRVEWPDVASALGSSWTKRTEDVLGEFGFWCYLRGGLPSEIANRGAQGWGGDRLLLFRNAAGAHALILLSSWDTPAEALEFHGALEELRRSRPGSTLEVIGSGQMRWSESSRGGFAAVRGNRVVLVIAPDQETAQRAGASLLN